MKICILYAGNIEKQIIKEIKELYPQTDTFMVKSKFDLFNKNSYRPIFTNSIDNDESLITTCRDYDIVLEQIDFISKNIASSIVKNIEENGSIYIKFKTKEKASKNPRTIHFKHLIDKLKTYL